MTTNHLEHMDPALYRSGRLDHHIHMNKPTADDVIHALAAYDNVSPSFIKKLEGSLKGINKSIDADMQMAFVKACILMNKPTNQSKANQDACAQKCLNEILGFPVSH